MEQICLIDKDYVNTHIKKRDRDLHKGSCGKVLIIAGSKGMAGAAVLCARGALRSGAGLVRISAPEEIYPILQISVPEATCVSRNFSEADLEEYQAIVVGPGLGGEDSAEKSELFEKLLNYTGALVADADGLNFLSRHPELKGRFRGNLILTPHPGEAGRLLGQGASEVNSDRVGSARRLAEEWQATAVLKGPGTIVAAAFAPAYSNTTGNPGMATGGCGDVLAGMIGSLCAQGFSAETAAAAGVYLHGLAGDLAANALGEYGMTAADVAAMAALALKETIGC